MKTRRLFAAICTLAIAACASAVSIKDFPFGQPVDEVVEWILDGNASAVSNNRAIIMMLDGCPSLVLRHLPFAKDDREGLDICVMTNSKTESPEDAYNRINNLCRYFNAKGVESTTDNNVPKTVYDINGYPLTVTQDLIKDNNYCVVLNYRDKPAVAKPKSSMIPEKGHFDIETADGKEWLTARGENVRISASCEPIKTDLGKYFRLYLYLSNEGKESIYFSPENIEVKALGAKSPFLKVETKADILKKVTDRSKDMKATAEAVHDADIRASMASRGVYQEGNAKKKSNDDLKKMNINRSVVTLNYLEDKIISEGMPVCGFVYIPYEGCKGLEVEVSFGGEKFQFRWKVKK